MRCECDKAFAEKLQLYENDWNIDHHRRWGANPFDAEQRCLTNSEAYEQRKPLSLRVYRLQLAYNNVWFKSEFSEIESPSALAARQSEKMGGIFSERAPQSSELDFSQRNSFKQSQKYIQQEFVQLCADLVKIHWGFLTVKA